MKLTTVLLIIGVTGSVLFFPVRIDRHRSCLTDFLITAGRQGLPDSTYSTTKKEDTMAQNYVIPYGLLWWSSLAIIFFSARRLAQKGSSHSKRFRVFNSRSLLSV